MSAGAGTDPSPQVTLLSVRLTVNFPVTEHHHPLASTKL